MIRHFAASSPLVLPNCVMWLRDGVGLTTATPANWAATSARAVGVKNILATPNGYTYQCSDYGSAPHKTGSTAPSSTTIGESTVDGNITWITLPGIAEITTWADQSGNSFSPTQATQRYKPQNYNGSQYFQSISGTGHYLLTTSNSIGQNVTGLSIFVVMKTSADLSALHYAVTVQDNATGIRGRIGSDASSKAYIAGKVLDANSTATGASSTSLSTSTDYIFSGMFNYSAATAALYVNGASWATIAALGTAGNSSNTASAGTYIGHTTTGTTNNFIYSVIIFNRLLSAIEQDMIEGYLGNRFRIALAG